jgi:hypothetical protein
MYKGVVWSIKSVKTGLVISRSPIVYIKQAKLKVSEAGRMRVLKEKRKNVHAGVEGIVLKSKPKNKLWTRVSYNPYKNKGFTTADGLLIQNATYVILNKNGCFVSMEDMNEKNT